MQYLFDRCNHVLQAAPELIGAGQILEMPPEAFDRVQFRTVSWQPKDQHPMLK